MGDAISKEEELAFLLEKFALFIRAHIQKYNPQRYGMDPEDILQEVRIKLWKLLRSEKNIANYPSYIRKVVDTSVIDQLRRLKREEDIFLVERKKQVEEHELLYSPEAARLRSLKDSVGRAVESLIESRKRVVQLYLLNMTIEEISAYFQWTEHKTRNLLYRGLADLKRILKKWDIEYEDQR